MKYFASLLVVSLCYSCFDSSRAGSLSGSELSDTLSGLKGLMIDLRSKFDVLQSRVERLETKAEDGNVDTESPTDLKMAMDETKRSKRDVSSDVSSASGSRRIPPPWTMGRPGRDGRDGRDGLMGPVGPAGQNGLTAEDLETVIKKVIDYKNSESKVPSISSRNDSGAVYVRWGRTVCPSHSQLIYDGFVAGSHYTHSGGGVNKLCLPTDPQFDQTNVPAFQSGGHVYGTEFEVNGFNPFSNENTRGHQLHDSNAVCAVCLALSRPSHVMIPAKKDCPSGWMKEYHGYLMSSHYQHKKSSYDCVDIAPEANDSGVGDQNGALFYISESTCGNSLPCPPYIQGAELTCVVCTR